MSIDYDKVRRQLEAADRRVNDNDRRTLVHLLQEAYDALQADDLGKVKRRLLAFETLARKLHWKGGGQALPRPFHVDHMDRLYWQTKKAVGDTFLHRTGDGKPMSWQEAKALGRF